MKNIICAFALFIGLNALHAAEEEPSVYVDENGVMRWTASGEELALFGVNYTTPFAHSFRAHNRLGVSLESAIDQDVYHLSRLGLDAYRIHIWDREITDPEGNLVLNEHVRVFDYLLAQLKKRGIKIILTPLQFGNAAYPEGGVPLDGFSSKYGKKGSLEDKTSWPLQERYLSQLVSHVNPYTGVAYKDDPDILAFEICNEPGHFEYDLTKEYINLMAKSIRDTGSSKPIFYNMSHGLPVFEAYLDADIQGGTFQWYPANLVANQEQRGNFLPYVDNYPIPFADNPKFKRMAKMVYEFDAADIGRSYIYPAISRTYRKAGMQFATMFAYDPINIAPYNTEYQTHYMNLAYAPSKALGLMVAAEAFRRVPMYADYGDYPNNVEFEGIRVDYESDLAELAVEDKFLYSNSTTTNPPAPEKLVSIAGFGNSPVVKYAGKGAYFIDQLESGVWRLEVMPDAIWVRDPYEKPNPEKHVSRIAWNEWPMEIKLPDLGEGFSAVGLNDENEYKSAAVGNILNVRPGVYMLSRKGVSPKLGRNDKWKNIVLKEFVAPKASINETFVLHTPIVEATASEDFKIRANVISDKKVEKVQLVAFFPKPPVKAEKSDGSSVRSQPGMGNTPGVGERDARGFQTFDMSHVSGFEYGLDIPSKTLFPGAVRYHIAVQTSEGYEAFPSKVATFPTDWNFYGESWHSRIVSSSDPVLLFDAGMDSTKVTADHRDVRYELVPSDRPGTDAMEVLVDDLAKGEHDHSLRFFFKDKVASRRADLAAKKDLVLYGKSATDKPCKIQLSLITEDGIAYGGILPVKPKHGKYSLPISALKQVRSPNIPHGYPVFIDFWSSVSEKVPLDLNHVESVLVSIGPGMLAKEYDTVQGVEIERIWLD